MSVRAFDLCRMMGTSPKPQKAWLQLCLGRGKRERGLAVRLLRQLHCAEPDLLRFIETVLEPQWRGALFEGGLIRLEVKWGSLSSFTGAYVQTPLERQRKILLRLLKEAGEDREHGEEILSLALELLGQIRLTDGILKSHRAFLLRLYETQQNKEPEVILAVRNFLHTL